MGVMQTVRIQQLIAQRSILQGKLMQNTINCFRVLRSPNFTGRKEPPTELPFVMNNIVIQCQLKMIEEELNNLKRSGKNLDYFA